MADAAMAKPSLTDEEYLARKRSKLTKRGLFTTFIPLTLNLLVGYTLDVNLYVAVAVGMQLLVFLIHGLPFQSEKYYDISGSVTHLAVVVTSLVANGTRPRSPRQTLAAVASAMWLARLGTFLYGRILKDGKDDRFKDLKTVFMSWLGCWSFQAAWVTLIQLPVILLNAAEDPALESGTTTLDMVAAVLWMAGFVIEVMADAQKGAFRAVPENRHRYITTGLWRYSRHPNYFGEILMWGSMGLACSSMALSGGGAYLHAGWISCGFTMLLLLKVSGVPMVEGLGQKKWGEDPAYVHYMAHTSSVLPWFPAGAGPVQEKKAE